MGSDDGAGSDFSGGDEDDESEEEDEDEESEGLDWDELEKRAAIGNHTLCSIVINNDLLLCVCV